MAASTHVALGDRTLPHAIEAEQATLGAVLLRSELWADVAAVVGPGDWFRDAHRRIWEAMGRLHDLAVAIDLLTVRHELARVGELDAIGGPAYLASLVDGVPRSTNVRHYAGVVRELATLRRLIAVAEEVGAAAYGQEPSEDIVGRAMRALLQCQPAASDAGTTLGAAATAYVEALGQQEAVQRVTCGLRDVDDLLLGGLRRKRLAIVAARPSVGKTSFGLGMAMASARAGVRAAFVSLEMDTLSLSERALAWHAKIDGRRLQTKALAEDDYRRLGQSLASFERLPLLFYDRAHTLHQVAAIVHRLRQRPEGLGLLVVDYLQLLHGERAENMQQAIAAISKGLKRIATDEDVALVALSQLSRAPETRKDKRPHLQDLRDSGALEQDADVVLLLFREEMHAPTPENAGLAEVIVAKHREGPTGVQRVAFLPGRAWFEDLAPEWRAHD